MLKLKAEEIIRAGGKISKKKEKRIEKSFCKTYATPKDVIKYFNNPNRCIHCNRTIPTNALIHYKELKSQIFCNKNCERKYFSTEDKLEILRKKVIFKLHSALADCINYDTLGLHYAVKSIEKKLWTYIEKFEDNQLEF